MKAEPVIRQRAKDMRGALTDAEAILWSKLKGRQLGGWMFRRQLPIGRYIVDFACAKARLVVEVDGATHSSIDEQAYDAERTAFIEGRGWSVLRINNHDIYRNLHGVLETIRDHAESLAQARSFPPPAEQGEVDR